MKIYIVSQAGFGDILYVYSLIKNLKKILGDDIVLFSSREEWLDRYRQTFPENFVEYRLHHDYNKMNAPYWDPTALNMKSDKGKRYLTGADFDEEFIVYYLYKNTISISNSQNPVILDSIEKQKKFYGNDIFDKYKFQKPVLNNGFMPLGEIWTHLHNIPCNFYDAKDLFSRNADFIQFNPPPHDYVTVHQWGFVYDGYNTKFWYPEYWEVVIDYLVDRGIKVYQVGAADEKLLSSKVESLLGEHSFMQTCKLVANSKLHIDVEGSFVHLAALAGTPCLALCGPSLDCWRHPEAKNIVYLEANNVCPIAPCEAYDHYFAKRCSQKHHACMKFIHPQMVIDEIGKVIK